MNQRTIALVVILFILVVAGMFGYATLRNSELAREEAATATPQPATTTPDAYASIERVTAKHFFIDGTHTLVGEIPLPTPCDLLEADAVVAESMPEQVTVRFNVINNAESCAQVITPQRFMVTASASEAATFTATLNGRPVTLNLVPPAPGETPEDFELFIKG